MQRRLYIDKAHTALDIFRFAAFFGYCFKGNCLHFFYAEFFFTMFFLPQPNYNKETYISTYQKIEDKHPNTQKLIQTDSNQRWKKSEALLVDNF